ncbi:MAG: hypothetical protein NW214_09325 [Pseudanabaenaceae cyanobacterium bins.39]|nr:hypothetical protein [Pseudanabaenaceae cyanobacterium bins.39]
MNKLIPVFRQKIRQVSKSIFTAITLALLVALAIALPSCGSQAPQVKSTPIPALLFLQASPDGQIIDGLVPSDLVQALGSLEQVTAAIPTDSQITLTQFGEDLGTLQIKEVRVSSAFGAIASLRVQPLTTSDRPPFNPAVLRQQNLTITVGQHQGDRRYFFNCPKGIPKLVLEKSQQLFTDLGIPSADLSRVAIASLACVDIDGDQQPEIIAGMRLDNARRPVGFDPQPWQAFLRLSPLERQEYSVLAVLRQSKQQQWNATPIVTHTRALSYINDSVSSYALFGIQDLNGDRYPELLVKEIGLNSLDVKVLSFGLDPDGNWQWQNFYDKSRSLKIEQ